MPDLATVETIASVMPVKTVVLSGISATVLLSCLDAANRWHDWFIDGVQVTYSQYAEILGYLAQARTELMTPHIGEVRISAAAALPLGCLWCDGGTYEKADYPDLYAALDAAFIVDADRFITPDLRSRFVWGSDTGSPIGSTGGEATHTLSIGEIPSHSHSIPATVTTLALEPGEVVVLSPVPLLPASTGDTGGSGSHNNLPPYLSLGYYIIAL